MDFALCSKSNSVMGETLCERSEGEDPSAPEIPIIPGRQEGSGQLTSCLREGTGYKRKNNSEREVVSGRGMHVKHERKGVWGMGFVAQDGGATRGRAWRPDTLKTTRELEKGLALCQNLGRKRWLGNETSLEVVE